MDENKLLNLINDDGFIEEILDCSSREEIKNIFENNGKSISEEEIDYLIESIEKASQTANTICSDKSMDIVAGGTDYDPLNDSLTRHILFRTQNTGFNPTSQI